jgi:hypothetical protein
MKKSSRKSVPPEVKTGGEGVRILCVMPQPSVCAHEAIRPFVRPIVRPAIKIVGQNGRDCLP